MCLCVLTLARVLRSLSGGESRAEKRERAVKVAAGFVKRFKLTNFGLSRCRCSGLRRASVAASAIRLRASRPSRVAVTWAECLMGSVALP
jgi:hypothetical protein